MSQLHVLVDGRLAGTRPTGIHRYIIGLVGAMAVREDLRLTAVVLSLAERSPRWDQLGPGIDLVELDLPPGDPRAVVALPRISRALSPDVLLHPHVTPAVIGHGCPNVVTVHDTKHLGPGPERSSLPTWRRGAMAAAFALSTRATDAVIAVSDQTRRDIEALRRGRGPRVHVVHEGVAAELLRADDDDVARLRQTRNWTRPWLLCVGESRPHKNHARLIEAYATSEASGTHDLLLVGRPHDAHGSVLGAIERVDANVRWIDDLDDNDLSAAYAGATAFVLPSLHEGFGLPLVEAMAIGTPVITSNTTACAEVVADAALTVDPTSVADIREAIDRVVASPGLASDLADRGRRRAAGFTWQRAADETTSILRDVATRRVGSPERR